MGLLINNDGRIIGFQSFAAQSRATASGPPIWRVRSPHRRGDFAKSSRNPSIGAVCHHSDCDDLDRFWIGTVNKQHKEEWTNSSDSVHEDDWTKISFDLFTQGRDSGEAIAVQKYIHTYYCIPWQRDRRRAYTQITRQAWGVESRVLLALWTRLEIWR